MGATALGTPGDAERPLSQDGVGGPAGPAAPDSAEWAQLVGETVAHLAAQLTIAQLRLAALATELEQRRIVEPEAVRIRLAEAARRDAGHLLRENLGEALSEAIDVEALATDIAGFLA